MSLGTALIVIISLVLNAIQVFLLVCVCKALSSRNALIRRFERMVEEERRYFRQLQGEE